LAAHFVAAESTLIVNGLLTIAKAPNPGADTSFLAANATEQ
jgi:hypothetical protein